MNNAWLINRHINLVLKKTVLPFFLMVFVLLTTSCQSLSLLNNSNNLIEDSSGKDYFLVGSYNKNPEHGVYLLSYDQKSQQLQTEKVVAKTLNPSYLNWQAKQQTLYSIATTADKSPLLQVYQWKKSQQQFELVNSQKVAGKGVCHINVNHDQSQLAVVNYTSGESSLYTLNSTLNGAANNPAQSPELKGTFKNSGRSLTTRQTSPHLHYAGWDNHNRFVYLTDLGTDEIIVFDSHSAAFVPQQRIKLDAGDGPRHLAFHPSKNIIYSLNELSNSITVFAQNIKTGALTATDKIMLLPENSLAKNRLASAIRITNDGRHLYLAMRGDNMLYGFSIQENGQLTLINKVSSGGNHPRDFNFSRNQEYLLVANQLSNQINLINRDKETGKLSLSKITTTIENPSFIQVFN